MISVLDCNNFWSPSGGGVRRYHLERMDFYRDRDDVRVIFLMQDCRTFTEEISSGLVVEHVHALKIPGGWDYRFIWQPWLLRRYIQKHRPDLLEIGSPYWLPVAARWATWGLAKAPLLLGFWHADFPTAYVGRGFSHISPTVGRLGEAWAWAYARWAFFHYRGIQVSCRDVMTRMERHGLTHLHWIPLGVDVQLFHPGKRDLHLVEELKAGNPHRLTIFFPHRLTEEKGADTLLEAYPELCRRLGQEPAIVFASLGPYKEAVQKAAERWKHIRYLGFVQGAEEMARWYASTDMGLALSSWETFGLSILESMASGQCLVGADQGAAKEHIVNSGCGRVVPHGNASALVEAIVSLTQTGEREQCSTRARTYAEKFTWRTCFERQVALYQTLVETP